MKPSTRQAYASSPPIKAESKWIKLALALLLGLTVNRANAGEIWIPATPAGAKVEFVTLDSRPDIAAFSSGMFDTRIEIGLHNDTNTYSISYWSGSDNTARNLAIFESLNQARENSTPVNILVDGDTREVYAVRIGATGHPLAVRRLDRRTAGLAEAVKQGIRVDALGRQPARGHATTRPSSATVTAR